MQSLGLAIKSLQEQYDVLEASLHIQSNKRSCLDLFHGWFSCGNPNLVNPVHQAFMESVEELLASIEKELSYLQPQCLGAPWAKKTADIMMNHHQYVVNSPEKWYLTAVEGMLIGLVPYFSAADVMIVEKMLLQGKSKALLLPSQKKLLLALLSRH